jgi:PAB-dependent poly(A)-specific ribonuclease subunit 3
LADFYLPTDLHQRLLKSSHLLHASPPPSSSSLPTELHSYTSLFPLASTSYQPSKLTSNSTVTSTLYRATSTVNGHSHYILKRLHAVSLPPTTPLYNIIHPLTMLTGSSSQHPNIVPLYECFTTKSFHDDSLVFVYHYFPLSTTLFSYLQSTSHLASSSSPTVPEPLLWSWACQIASGLTWIHDANMACRCLSLDNLLLSEDLKRLALLFGGL